jgi:predicted ABC-type ATPase
VMADLARVTVIAGVNGAGKSSFVGEALRQSGGEYFNPDEATQGFLEASPSMTSDEANSRAWVEGRERLEQAIRDHQDYVFETTLGGNTMTMLLLQALEQNLEVAVLFVGLVSVELHLERIASRVAAGGHAIAESKVRERYVSSIKNLVRLAPYLTELRVLDNSADADPKTGHRPQPRELLLAAEGKLKRSSELTGLPDWVKPVLAVLMRH